MGPRSCTAWSCRCRPPSLRRPTRGASGSASAGRCSTHRRCRPFRARRPPPYPCRREDCSRPADARHGRGLLGWTPSAPRHAVIDWLPGRVGSFRSICVCGMHADAVAHRPACGRRVSLSERQSRGMLRSIPPASNRSSKDGRTCVCARLPSAPAARACVSSPRAAARKA